MLVPLAREVRLAVNVPGLLKLMHPKNPREEQWLDATRLQKWLREKRWPRRAAATFNGNFAYFPRSYRTGFMNTTKHNEKNCTPPGRGSAQFAQSNFQ